jgi:hypothetical protein
MRRRLDAGDALLLAIENEQRRRNSANRITIPYPGTAFTKSEVVSICFVLTIPLSLSKL